MYPGVIGEDHPDSQVPSSSLTLVVKGRKHPAGPAPAPPSSRCSDLYRRIKRRLGCTFRRLYHKGWLIRSRKQLHINFLELKAVLLALKEFEPLCQGQVVLVATDNSGGLHKQRRRHALRVPVCYPMETPVLVQSQGNLPESMSHPRPTQCDSRQTVQTSAGHSDEMVPAPRGLCSDLSQVAPKWTCSRPGTITSCLSSCPQSPMRKPGQWMS